LALNLNKPDYIKAKS